MTKEQMKHLREPYYSSKEKGTGLGMMVVYSIVKEMKGKIKVESEIGKGTTFTLLFPMSAHSNLNRDLSAKMDTLSAKNSIYPRKVAIYPRNDFFKKKESEH